MQQNGSALNEKRTWSAKKGWLGSNKAERHWLQILLLLPLSLLIACSTLTTPPNTAPSTESSTPGAAAEHEEDEEHAAEHDEHAELDSVLQDIAGLQALELADGQALQVVATTSLIGDVVAQVGGEMIELVTLMEPGVDPHSYTATPQTLRTLSASDVIFINGLQLEADLMHALTDAGVPLVAVNAMVTPLTGKDAHEEDDHEEDAHEEDEHDHGTVDPHTWQSVPNVMQWVEMIEATLGTLDPEHAAQYSTNAADYQQSLQVLDDEIRAQVATIPAAQRKLVTDHELFNYFAAEYGFTVVGSLVGSLSSTAQSSAQDFAALQDQLVAEEVTAIFIGSTANPALAEQLARDLGITVVPLYTDTLSPAEGPAATYLEFMRHNANAIVAALRGD